MLHLMIKSQNGKSWVQSKRWLHPNFISRCRYPMGVVSVLIFHTGQWLEPGSAGTIWQHLAVYWFTFWIITDVTDGTIARHFDLHTVEGESIDPLSDKLLLFPPLFYYAWLGQIPFYLVFLFLFFDLVGQFSRYFIKNKGANLFGKAKTFLTVITIVLITMQLIYFPGEPWKICYATLMGATFLAFCSMFFKIIPNYWYANLLSILNLMCGIAGIVLVLVYERPGWAFAAVFLGQFLDLFDGRAADRWGSTPKGELFDDWADGTNFGGTISVLIYSSFKQSGIGIFLALLHLSTVTFRLIRFVVNKRKKGVSGGTKIFMGLPAPAAALVAGSAALIQGYENTRMVIIFLTSFLMISKIPYYHFGRVVLGVIPKLVKVILLTLILLAVLLGYSTRNHQILYWTVFLFSFSYVLLGFNWKGMFVRRRRK